MGPCGLKKLVVPILLLVLLIGGAVYWAQRQWEPEVATVAASTLEALQQQNRLLVLSNNSSATVTTTQTRFGLSAKKTLIVQGLTANDVRWDAETETLSVRIPPIKIPPPQIDLNSIQEYGEAGILRSLTNVDDVLDASNRAKAQAELIKQAQSPVLMDLARAAAKKAVAQNFEVPLRAAGIDAKIAPFFDGETDKTVTTRWDVSTPLREAIGK
jgi:Protein of unknown function (DUF4230)